MLGNCNKQKGRMWNDEWCGDEGMETVLTGTEVDAVE